MKQVKRLFTISANMGRNIAPEKWRVPGTSLNKRYLPLSSKLGREKSRTAARMGSFEQMADNQFRARRNAITWGKIVNNSNSNADSLLLRQQNRRSRTLTVVTDLGPDPFQKKTSLKRLLGKIRSFNHNIISKDEAFAGEIGSHPLASTLRNPQQFAQVPTGIDEVLENKHLLALFSDFLTFRFAEESLLFIDYVETFYKHAERAAWRAVVGQSILSKFIVDGAPYQLNLSHEEREKLIKLQRNMDFRKDAFDEAKHSLMELMEENYFKSFKTELLSDYYC